MADALGAMNYAMVLLYGIFLSVSFAGGCTSQKERRCVAVLCIAVLMVQGLCWQFWGLGITMRCYPFISHLPLVLTLVIALKRQWGVAVVSVLTAYFCCQLPRWIATIALYIYGSQLAYEMGYIISIVPIFCFLEKYFAVAAHRAMTYSKRSLYLFGGLPLFYYLFDYATTVYTNALYEGIRMISEFLPAAMALFYVVFVAVYHNEVQRRNRIELQNSLLSMQFEQAKHDVSALLSMQEQTAAHRHDMRHHLAMIGGYLKTGDAEKAMAYIEAAEYGISQITPERYCANVAVNLILSSFEKRGKQVGVDLSVEANVPESLPISEMELSALLSNGIENAVTAAAQYGGEERKTVRINCQMHKGHLLIFISNPYEGGIIMRDGLPQSHQPEHGFGVKSIKMIADLHGGFCSFEAEDALFTLKVVLPLEATPV